MQIILTLVIILKLSLCFEYDEKLAQDLAAFSNIAYCNEDLIKNWKCGDACQLIKSGLADIYVMTNNTMESRVYAGYSSAYNAIIISFRGTDIRELKNWIRDLDIVKVQYSYCYYSCSVHEGFLKQFNDIQEQLQLSFQKLRTKYPQAKIYVTGHSLGAAMGALSLPVIKQLNKNKPVDVFYTFGSPRVGDAQYVKWFQKQNFAIQQARINNGRDPIPHLPPQMYPFNFEHYGKEVYYKSFTDNKNEHKQCENVDETKCAEEIKFAYSMPDHLHYFGWSWRDNIQQCRY